jgi:outer membrane receptor protein involved in Fe transport
VRLAIPKSFIFLLILGIVTVAGGITPSVFAGGVQTLDPVEVTDSADDLVGTADSSTEGTVTPKQLEDRPVLRTGEVLETVPGVVISQHSGEGKANQYYLRGFNLDHGTDLATTVAGMPVNMPTHAHGQGYSDLNFMIPELISGVQYRKGPYYAEMGDFSAAGAVNMDYGYYLEHGIAQLTLGSFAYRRALVAASPSLAGGHLLYALEVFHNDGPWDHPDNYRKINGVLRYSRGDQQNGFSVTAMAYNGKWNATDQVAERAIEEGLISRYGSLDPSDGGLSHRYSLSAEWQQTAESSITKANAYVIDYALNLFSNFTYFLDDTVNGDQIEQADQRVISGFKVSQEWLGKLADHDMSNTIGLQVRNDNIAKVALYHTKERQILSVTSQDHVAQTSVGVYLQNRFQWMEKFRTVAGVRTDFYRFHVISDNPENSGVATDVIASPKLSLVFGPWAKTEYYINAGYGFHSNDGRGTTITTAPKVTPLVRAKGAEVGARTAVIPHLQSELTFWILDLDSELLFTGDAGTTEPSRPSRRYGAEWANYYTPISWFTVDADFAFANARFTDSDPAGDRIPGSPEGIISMGASIDNLSGFLGSVRLRYFGPRPLTEDNSVRSQSSTLVNARIGYEFYKNWRVTLDVFNVFDSKVSDVDYYYASRLAGEPPCGPPHTNCDPSGSGGYMDIHTHPEDPREARVTLTATF